MELLDAKQHELEATATDFREREVEFREVLIAAVPD